jgi:phycocyanin-associated, rod
MLGHSVLASNTVANDRVFVYEVEGLRQNDQTGQDSYSIRSSGTSLVQVPFNRMNEFMQRITRVGAKIVAIRTPNGDPVAAPTHDAAEH